MNVIKPQRGDRMLCHPFGVFVGIYVLSGAYTPAYGLFSLSGFYCANFYFVPLLFANWADGSAIVSSATIVSVELVLAEVQIGCPIGEVVAQLP